MQPVSQEWIINQTKPLVDKGHLKIELYVANTDMYLNTTELSAYTGSYYDLSNLDNVVDEDAIISNQSLLGLNQFILDGSIVPPNSYEPQPDAGLVIRGTSWQGVRGMNSNFQVTFASPTQQKCKSLKVVFNEAYPDKFQVGFNDPQSTSITVYPTSNEFVVELDNVVNFTTMTFYAENGSNTKFSLPSYCPMIKHVFLGFTQTFQDNEIIDYEAKEIIHLDNNELPQNELNFTIDNSQGIFDSDPNNTDPSNIYQYLSTRQRIVVSYGFGDEWIKGGTYYLSEWKCPQNGITASFSAKNILMFMSQTYEMGSSFTKLIDVANDVCGIANISVQIRNFTNAKLSETRTCPALPSCTCAEALQNIAFASNSLLYCDRNGKINLVDPTSFTLDTSYSIGLDYCYKYPEISLGEEVLSMTIGSTTVVNSGVTSGNEKVVDDGSKHLIPNSTIATDVCQYLLSVANKRVNYECKLRIDPRIDIGDIVPLVNKNNNVSPVIITGTKIAYNGAFSGVLEAKEWQ